MSFVTTPSGNTLSVNESVMTRLGLSPGQRVSDTQAQKIIVENASAALDHLKAQGGDDLELEALIEWNRMRSPDYKPRDMSPELLDKIIELSKTSNVGDL